MEKQYTLFDYPLDVNQLTSKDVADALKQFQLIHKEHGNPPGGVIINELPEDLRRKVKALCSLGYAKTWLDNERIILKEAYHIPNTPEEVLPKFMEVAKKLRYSELLSYRTLWSIRYHDPGLRHVFWDASVEICREYISVEDYIKDYNALNSPINEKNMRDAINILCNMTDEQEIKEFLSSQSDGGDAYFLPSGYDCVFISKCTDPKQMVQLLRRCGRVFGPKK